MIRNLRKKTRMTLVIGAGICLLVSFLSANSHVQAQDNTPSHPTKTIVVHSGQSLWSISQQIAKPNEDVRDIVYELCKLNHLQSPQITPGMKLIIPNR
jgi:LysM repeat protein